MLPAIRDIVPSKFFTMTSKKSSTGAVKN